MAPAQLGTHHAQPWSVPAPRDLPRSWAVPVLPAFSCQSSGTRLAAVAFPETSSLVTLSETMALSLMIKQTAVLGNLLQIKYTRPKLGLYQTKLNVVLKIYALCISDVAPSDETMV